MASVRFTDVQARPTEFLDLTSLTRDEFQQLVAPFEAAFRAHLAAWRLDGKPRTARRFTVYKNCPLPTPEDRLFFIVTDLKTYALQVVQGRRYGGCPAGGGSSACGRRTRRHTGLPPFAHDGTERRIVRPQDPAEQQESYSGKTKDHTIKNVLLVNALLIILFLSDTYGGRVHDLRIAEATPYPLPA